MTIVSTLTLSTFTATFIFLYQSWSIKIELPQAVNSSFLTILSKSTTYTLSILVQQGILLAADGIQLELKPKN